MAEEEKQFFKCSECGDVFDSEEFLEEHFRVKHSDKKYKGPAVEEASLKDNLEKIRPYMNTSLVLGIIIGILLTSMAFGSVFAYNEFTGPGTVDVTVVSCDECDYGRFQNATDRMFDTNYNEVDYQSDKGQELIEKYGLDYVPGFILEKDVENHENFTQIRGTVISMEDGYVLNVEAARRFSEGQNLN